MLENTQSNSAHAPGNVRNDATTCAAIGNAPSPSLIPSARSMINCRCTMVARYLANRFIVGPFEGFNYWQNLQVREARDVVTGRSGDAPMLVPRSSSLNSSPLPPVTSVGLSKVTVTETVDLATIAVIRRIKLPTDRGVE